LHTIKYVKNTEVIKNNKNITKSISSEKEVKSINTALKELIKYKDALIDMLKHYENNKNIITNDADANKELNINAIPQEFKVNAMVKSVKIYGPIGKKFDKLCEKYNAIKKQDLISLALLEFTNKYLK